MRLRSFSCFVVVLSLIALFSGCKPSEQDLRSLLEKRAQMDLDDIIKETKAKGIDSLLSSSPSFKIVKFKIFQGDTARVFRAMSQVHFFYLKSLQLYQVRKYRYQSSLATWDRYEVELKHLSARPDSL